MSKEVAEFQFPTGWNSTNEISEFEVLGVEFQFPTGWNSTLVAFFLLPLSIVSIPNGMEFYAGKKKRRDNSEGFNSQRDGILQ